MASTFLNSKSIGDIIKIRENGVAANYIIIHKGRPSSLYDSSCNGVWVLRETGLDPRAQVWDKTSDNSDGYDNDYENSDINAWLNGTFLNTIESDIRAAVKTVRIPYKKGTGNASTGVQSGSNGLSCKVFLLSMNEVGMSYSTWPADGAKLDYFLSGTDTTANSKRICLLSSGNKMNWWTRTVDPDNTQYVLLVGTGGSSGKMYANSYESSRPAFILPSNLLVTSDNFLSVNTLPTITSNKTGNLGTLTGGFSCKYSVNDEDTADSVRVTLTMDSTTIRTFTATKGSQYTYSLAGSDWLKITNGTHAFRIAATDGKDTVTSTATFTRACRKATVTLTSALSADDIIRFCSLKVRGALPMDTILKCEVTNNANDTSPVWEDCTARVKSETAYVFKNNKAANGFAFNFRISAERGASGIGGYITTVCGGFE